MASEANAAASAARLAALRYQLNPHFLFNTLNAVSAAVITQSPGNFVLPVLLLAASVLAIVGALPEGSDLGQRVILAAAD